MTGRHATTAFCVLVFGQGLVDTYHTKSGLTACICGIMDWQEKMLEGHAVPEDGGLVMLGFNRITFDPNVMGGRACIRGMRITVSLVVNLVAGAMSVADILRAYPYLEPEDVGQSLQYAAWLAEEAVHVPEPVAA